MEQDGRQETNYLLSDGGSIDMDWHRGHFRWVLELVILSELAFSSQASYPNAMSLDGLFSRLHTSMYLLVSAIANIKHGYPDHSAQT
jgi:hypothetical protein